MGWDYGLTPAGIFIHPRTTPGGIVLEVFDELVSERAGISRFTDLVKMHSAIHYPECSFTHYGDPAGVEAAQTDERTCYQVQSDMGINVIPGIQSPEARHEAVRYWLTRQVDGAPAFRLSPRCKVLRRGFNGGYKWRRMQLSSQGGDDARYADKPDKNSYSHPHDALQYPLTRLIEGIKTSQEMEKHRQERREVETMRRSAEAWRG